MWQWMSQGIMSPESNALAWPFAVVNITELVFCQGGLSLGLLVSLSRNVAGENLVFVRKFESSLASRTGVS